MQQPILNSIVVGLFFCADKSSNVCNGNVVHTEDTACIRIDRKTYDGVVFRSVKSVRLNPLTMV